MGQFQRKHTDADVARWREILGRHAEVRDALREIGVPKRSVVDVFKRYGEYPGQWLAKPKHKPGARNVTRTPEVPPPDLLDQHAKRNREALLKSERNELLERLAEAEARFRFAERLAAHQEVPPRITRRERASGLREGTAVALLSDCHIEEMVDPRAVANRNEYNLQIAERRMDRFFDGLRWLVEFNRGAWAIRDLVLWFGGDLMTGAIHEELVETNELSPVETVLTLRGWLRRGILHLLEDRKLVRIVIPCNFGNHGRTTQKRRIKTGAQNSFEWMLYEVLKTDFAEEPRVIFEVPRSAHAYVDVYDYTLHFAHGDDVRYWGGVGGLSIPLNKRIPKWDNVKHADFHHVGHFHQLLDLGHTLVNGSLIGYSDFAFSIGADFEPPQQGFYVLDAKRGKANVTPIWVDETGESDAK